MDISVVITTYNRLEFVKRAIKSASNQTYAPEEIIVIEDASDSGIEQWIKKNHPQIIYKKNKQNLGLAGSRNVGIELAKSGWIAFLDDDDEWMPNRLEEQVKCFQNLSKSEKKDLACIQVGNKIINKINNTENVKLPVNDGMLEKSIREKGASTTSSGFLFLRDALVKVDGFDEELISGIDHDIWMKLAVHGYSNKAVMKPLVLVTFDKNESMMSNTINRINGIRQYTKKWEPTYRKWYGEGEGKTYAQKYFIRVIGALAAQKLVTRNYEHAKLAVKEINKTLDKNLSLKFIAFFYIVKRFLSQRFPILTYIKFWK